MVGHNDVYGLQGTWLKSEKEKGADCTLSKESEKKFVKRNSFEWCMSQKDSVECTKESTVCWIHSWLL